jgi:gliding motility-associated lipoprotein GldH
MNKYFITALLSIILLFSCNSNDIYFRYQTLPAAGWEKDSALLFVVTVLDTVATYNVSVNIRNTSEYPYQNFWLFINKEHETRVGVSNDTIFVSRNKIFTDTVNFYLADDSGKWLGTGVGAAFDMPVLIEENVKFSAAGSYRYKIYQGMREDMLKGIRDIGLRVEKVEK